MLRLETNRDAAMELPQGVPPASGGPTAEIGWAERLTKHSSPDDERLASPLGLLMASGGPTAKLCDDERWADR